MLHKCTCLNLEAKTHSICGGLYAFLYSSPTSGKIYDKNTTPKIVLYPTGLSLKSGKFEKEFVKRHKVTIKHLSHVSKDGQKFEFNQFFQVGYVLDLSECKMGLVSTARVFERYWTEHINSFLEWQNLLADKSQQNKRAEWRTIDPSLWNHDVETLFHEYLIELDSRIMKMIDVGRLSPRFQ